MTTPRAAAITDTTGIIVSGPKYARIIPESLSIDTSRQVLTDLKPGLAGAGGNSVEPTSRLYRALRPDGCAPESVHRIGRPRYPGDGARSHCRSAASAGIRKRFLRLTLLSRMGVDM